MPRRRSSRSTTQRGILRVIAEQLPSVVPVDAVYIYAADESQNRFLPVYATGSEAKARMAYGYSMDSGVNGWAFKIGVPQYVKNVSAHPATITIPGTPVGEPESYLIIPLIAGDRRLGVLDCSRLGTNRFTSRDLEAAALFGHTAAAAWRNAELYAELTERAILDPLTGLLNSRWLREVGEREVSQSLAQRSVACDPAARPRQVQADQRHRRAQRWRPRAAPCGHGAHKHDSLRRCSGTTRRRGIPRLFSVIPTRRVPNAWRWSFAIGSRQFLSPGAVCLAASSQPPLGLPCFLTTGAASQSWSRLRMWPCMKRSAPVAIGTISVLTAQRDPRARAAPRP